MITPPNYYYNYYFMHVFGYWFLTITKVYPTFNFEFTSANKLMIMVFVNLELVKKLFYLSTLSGRAHLTLAATATSLSLLTWPNAR